MTSPYKPSYWHNPGPDPLSPLTIGQLVDIAAETYGAREAIVSLYQGHRYSFLEVKEKVNAVRWECPFKENKNNEIRVNYKFTNSLYPAK